MEWLVAALLAVIGYAIHRANKAKKEIRRLKLRGIVEKQATRILLFQRKAQATAENKKEFDNAYENYIESRLSDTTNTDEPSDSDS